MVLPLLFVLLGCKGESEQEPPSGVNSVVEYLRDAERQSETDDQRAEILRALGDLLSMPPESLRVQRYSNYTGDSTSWNSQQILRAYFLPSHPVDLIDSLFYSEYTDTAAQSVIRGHLNKLIGDRESEY